MKSRTNVATARGTVELAKAVSVGRLQICHHRGEGGAAGVSRVAGFVQAKVVDLPWEQSSGCCLRCALAERLAPVPRDRQRWSGRNLPPSPPARQTPPVLQCHCAVLLRKAEVSFPEKWKNRLWACMANCISLCLRYRWFGRRAPAAERRYCAPAPNF